MSWLGQSMNLDQAAILIAAGVTLTFVALSRMTRRYRAAVLRNRSALSGPLEVCR